MTLAVSENASRPAIWFFVDVGASIGLGHIVRSQALAEALSQHATIRFFCVHSLSDRLDSASDFLRGQFVETKIRASEVRQVFSSTLPVGLPQAVVVDSYMLQEADFDFLRSVSPVLLAVDDLRSKKMAPDILVNQNLLGRTPDEARELYGNLVPGECRFLLGPQFALLRNQFSIAAANRKSSQEASSPNLRILVGFGGADPTCETEKVLEAFKRADQKHVSLTVLPLADKRRMEALAEMYGQLPNLLISPIVSNMSELLQSVDLAFGAAGSSVWERAATCVPSYLIQSAENQRDVVEGLKRTDIAILIGDGRSTTAADWLNVFNVRLSRDRARWPIMTAKGLSVVDGQGAIRVASVLMNKVNGI